MTHFRLITLSFACTALFVSGCTQDQPGSAAPDASGSRADTVSTLCDARDPSSLAGIATALERPDDESADTGPLSDSLTTAEENLRALEVDAAAQTAVDETISAIDDLQEVIGDPDRRADARDQTAEALRAADAAVCP